MDIVKLEQNLRDGIYDTDLAEIYGSSSSIAFCQRSRCLKAIEHFKELFPDRQVADIFSAPGRTEIGGNHTDHQNGCVLAAAVDLDTIAIVAFHNEGVIRLCSNRHDPCCIKLDTWKPQQEEIGTSSAIVRGMVSKFRKIGVEVKGFDAYTSSEVLSGSGLSSAAAFEVLLGTIIDVHYNHGRLGAVEIAKIGQYSENVFFGKKSGLMDQTVSAVGGFVFIDFKNPDEPKIKKIHCNFEKAGYALCITDTKGNHADLIDDYTSIPYEMQEIAKKFGETHLRNVKEKDFLAALPELRKCCSNRAVLRAAHFFSENKIAFEEAKALSQNDFEGFLRLVKKSGDSSAKWLQNIRAYLMTALYNAPSTMDIYYQAWVNYNMSHPKS